MFSKNKLTGLGLYLFYLRWIEEVIGQQISSPSLAVVEKETLVLLLLLLDYIISILECISVPLREFLPYSVQ